MDGRPSIKACRHDSPFLFFLNSPCEPSPYSPVSRLFPNELYLDLNQLGSMDPQFSASVDQLNAQSLIDYQQTASLKREIASKQFEIMLQSPENQQALQQFVDENPEVKIYALFRANVEHTGKCWRDWPLAQRKGNLNEQDIPVENYQYHLAAQWQMHKQLSQLKVDLNKQGQLLYLDLPIGAHRDGFDVWRWQSVYLGEANIGAPPDPLFLEGQNWGMPALNPEKLRDQGYSWFIRLIQNIFKQVDVLRIDHVMGFNRLYLIPNGSPASEGTYLNYPAEEIYAILSLESQRHRVMLVGENLGAVPPETTQLMKRHSMIGMHVLQYVLDAKQKLIPDTCKTLSSINTHDMPPFTAWAQALDIHSFQELGLIDKEYARKMHRKRQQHLKKIRTVLKKQNTDDSRLLFSLWLLQAKSPAALQLINIEDLWNETNPQNIPNAAKAPNWQRKLHYSLEQIKQMSTISEQLDAIHQQRKGGHTSSQSLFSDLDFHLFNEGTHFRLYDHLGSHPQTRNGVAGVYFSVWAPNASYVSVIGSFNDWNNKKHPLSSCGKSGVWEGFIAGAKMGDLYKYFIESRQHHFAGEKADPFAFYQETPPCTASIVWDLNYQWHDKDWLENESPGKA